MITHGHSPRSGQSSEYMTWSQMIQRCKNENNPGFINYGARGITVCKRWMIFKNFIEDMGPRPKNFTLERLDNSKGYTPRNCRWLPRTANNNNRRNNILLTHLGVTRTCSEWSRHSPVCYKAFRRRIKRGWPMELALSASSHSIRTCWKLKTT